MMNDVLIDRAFQQIIAKKAAIFSPEYMVQENCLWVTGAGVHSSYRQMFVHLQQIGEQVKVNLTITDDDKGFTNFLMWGYGYNEDKGPITQLLLFLIEDLLSGGGMEVQTFYK